MTQIKKMASDQQKSKAIYLSSQNKCTAKKIKRQAKKINFAELNKAVQSNMSDLIYKLLPYGETHGDEWFALNPTRYDNHIGSFSINTKSWKFFDFATCEGGHGAIALYAYLKGVKYYEAAKALQAMLEGRNE